MKKSKLMLVLLSSILMMMLTGCTAVITDDYGESYEIELDEAEEMAKEYIADEMRTYIADEVSKGTSLADVLGIDEAELEQIVREEIKAAVEEEMKNGDLVNELVGSDLGAILGSFDSQFSQEESSGKVEEKKVEEKKVEEKKAEEKKDEEAAGAEESKEKAAEKTEEKAEEKTSGKKDELKEKAGEKIEEAAEQIEEQKKEKAEAAKKEDKKTEDTKAEAAKTEDTKTEDKKTEDKKTEDKKSDEELKTEESVSGDKASTDAEVSETGYLKDGTPWVDYDLVDNQDKSVKTDPADDFYLYVNKYWLNNTSIKEGKSSASPINDIVDETRKKAEKLFEDDSLKSSDAKLIKSYHTAILDWDERNAAGTGPLEALVANIQKAETIDEINKLYLEDENRVFLEKFVNINNTASFNDSSKYIIAFDSCSLMLSDAAEYSKRTELGDRYYEGRKDE
ncbi:MAG: hypothetical protein J6P45_02670, partial [Lachnospiraceae bacterium]|nr:hypothetical protein [Lachnospiraceae bacterium]